MSSLRHVATGSGPTAAGPALQPPDYAAIVAIMQREARIALPAGKTVLVQSRLARRLRAHGLTSFRDYLALIGSDDAERAAMVVALTTNHTHFFRENHHFEHFRASAMPRLQAAVRTRPVRIWSAGCSSGEEVYSIAMCLLGRDRTAAAWLRGADLRLLATDLAPHVVEAARAGVYSCDSAAPVPAEYREQWMRPDGDRVIMAEEARDLVTARVLNLFEPWPMRGKFDVIFCRNVMIYFDESAKADLEARFVDSLRPGGYLYIGHSERLVGTAGTQMAACGQTIYVKRGNPL